MSSREHPFELDAQTEPQPKRQRLDTPDGQDATSGDADVLTGQASVQCMDIQTLLPPSRKLLGEPPVSLAQQVSVGHTLEFDVGISEYISNGLPPLHAIIKQRFTDFLVNEINLDGEVIHIESLDMPHSVRREQSESTAVMDVHDPSSRLATLTQSTSQAGVESPYEDSMTEDMDEWQERYSDVLSQYLSGERIASLKQMYSEGPEPPFVSDTGWESRRARAESEQDAPSEMKSGKLPPSSDKTGSEREKRRIHRRQDKGGHIREKSGAEDTRKVVSDPIGSKATRTALHKTIRELFKGKLDSETDTRKTSHEEGRIIIRWAKQRGKRRQNEGGRDYKSNTRGTYPPYIHFTMQKTNRDTQDALGHLSRILHCSIKDLSVAGTKDKRGVTVQRVALRRGNKTAEDVWKMVNSQFGRRTYEEAVTQRGERGVRVSDFGYRKTALDLGMLKGNEFVITLRNVQIDNEDTVNKAMCSLKEMGFINYYGMQRFGTASVPTHTIGLAILQADWQKAISLILQHRPGEHPDVIAARDAWLVEKDIDKALQLFPRRVVAERCILESYKKMKGDTRNAFGALSTIPRNLRLMYVHAYQSYVWNAIISERIRLHGVDKSVPGDLVYDEEGGKIFEEDKDEEIVDTMGTKENLAMDNDTESGSGITWVAPRVKILTPSDVNHYSIYDVLMPLPGKDVAYPEGVLGERYRSFLRMDGLDPDNFTSKHKDYNLSGSYRRIIHRPKDLSWTLLRYTDTNVSLAQSDEDKLLGFELPAINKGGKFLALQVRMQLGTAAYATMALREITKTETSSHYQTSLTQSSEEQTFRGQTEEVQGS